MVPRIVLELRVSVHLRNYSIFGNLKMSLLFSRTGRPDRTCSTLCIRSEYIVQRLKLESARIEGKVGRENTSRISNGFRFRAVRGVLPRSFPGVLKISVIFLLKVRLFLASERESVHLVLAEDLSHMLVEEIQFISNSEGKIFCLLCRELSDLLIFLVQPWH